MLLFYRTLGCSPTPFDGSSQLVSVVNNHGDRKSSKDRVVPLWNGLFMAEINGGTWRIIPGLVSVLNSPMVSKSSPFSIGLWDNFQMAYIHGL